MTVAVGLSLTLLVGVVACTPNDDRAGDSHSEPGDTDREPGEIPAGDDVVVERIVDGDTLRTEDDERVRLLNIDTPEPTEDECWADEATERLAELVPPGSHVRLVYDVEREDRYGRTLAQVYRLPDGLWVNLQLAADGAAYPYVVRPNDADYAPIKAATDEARDAGLGLWGACPLPN
jgi:micrococcal nuclease